MPCVPWKYSNSAKTIFSLGGGGGSTVTVTLLTYSSAMFLLRNSWFSGGALERLGLSFPPCVQLKGVWLQCSSFSLRR